MRRRNFITFLGGAAAAWPVAARAQLRTMPVVGYLYAGSREAGAARTEAFRKGLGEMGYVEGRNVAVEYRFAERNERDGLSQLATDLVRRQVAVLVASSAPAVFAAQAATTALPAVAGWDLHPLESAALSRRTRTSDIRERGWYAHSGHWHHLPRACFFQRSQARPRSKGALALATASSSEM